MDNYCDGISVEEMASRVEQMDKSMENIFKKRHNAQIINMMKMMKMDLSWN